MSVDNLHRPSSLDPAPNGTTPDSSDMSARAQLIRLEAVKKSVQARLDTCFAVLQVNNANMLTPLVDPEGFPRSDMDVAGVRTARAEVHRLRNDLTDVINKMAVLLEEALARGDEVEAGTVVDGVEGEVEVEVQPSPFAKVDGVFPGGPADQAGLKRDDLLLSMGSVSSSSSPQPMTAIATLVQTSQNVALPISILRPSSTTPISLTLTPRANWGGRGLLGMHIVPL